MTTPFHHSLYFDKVCKYIQIPILFKFLTPTNKNKMFHDQIDSFLPFLNLEMENYVDYDDFVLGFASDDTKLFKLPNLN